MDDCQRDSHATISRKPVVLGYIVAGFGSLWLVLLFCRWLWLVFVVVVGGFGSFWLVPCFSNYVNLWSIDRRERVSHARHPFVPMITPVQSISFFYFLFFVSCDYWIHCRWYWIVLVGFVGGFGWFLCWL